MFKMTLEDEKFDKRKKSILRELEKEIERESIDHDVLPLIQRVNSHRDLVTTSSCSGRIILIIVPREGGKKKDAVIIKKWHEITSFQEIWKEINLINTEKTVWLITQPLILHVLTRNLDTAKKLLSASRKAGFKKVGIISFSEKVTVQIEGHQIINLPVMDEGKILVTSDYLRKVVDICNIKLKEIKESLKRLEKEIGSLINEKQPWNKRENNNYRLVKKTMSVTIRKQP